MGIAINVCREFRRAPRAGGGEDRGISEPATMNDPAGNVDGDEQRQGQDEPTMRHHPQVEAGVEIVFHRERSLTSPSVDNGIGFVNHGWTQMNTDFFKQSKFSSDRKSVV